MVLETSREEEARKRVTKLDRKWLCRDHAWWDPDDQVSDHKATCRLLQDSTRNIVAELFCTLWSLMSKEVICKMPASVPTCYRDPGICKETGLHRVPLPGDGQGDKL